MAWDRFKRLLNGDDVYDDDENQEEIENEEVNESSSPVQDFGAPSGRSISSSTALEMKVCRPTKFEEATVIAEHLLQKRTVVLNLEDASKDIVMRIIDFLFGVAFAIDGSLKRVSSTTYVITPKNVEVSGERETQKPAAEPKPRELF